ncbi:MAG: glycosyltransferase family 39 protein [Candidatus Omnitrophica bacterium]|nr:glycosyltransferase family 39 protein [Candidatus Omnitrophota bacterium]
MHNQIKDTTYKTALILIFTLALFIRVFYVLTIATGPLISDAATYDTLAIKLLEGPPFFDAAYDSRRAPLYPLFLALWYYGAGHHYLIIKLAQALLSSLLVFIMYSLAQLFFNKRTALFSAAIVAVYPIFLYYSGVLLSETLFLFLLTFSVLLIGKGALKNASLPFWIGALLLGLATLTRPVSALLVVVISIWLFQLDITVSQKVRRTGMLCILFAAIITPWMMRNYRVHKSFVFITTEAGYQIFASNNPLANGAGVWQPGVYERFTKEYGTIVKQHPQEVDRQKYLFKEGLRFIKNNPKRYLWLMGDKFMWFWNAFPHTMFRDKIVSGLSYGILLPFFILGFFQTLFKRDRKLLLFHFIVLYFTFIHCTFSYGSLRFRLPIEPYIIILAAHVILNFVERMKGKKPESV